MSQQPFNDKSQVEVDENVIDCDDDGEEEVVVVAHFSGLSNLPDFELEHISFNVDSAGDQARCVLNGNLVFEGRFEVSLGSQLLFEEISSPEGGRQVFYVADSITNLPLKITNTLALEESKKIISSNSDIKSS